MLGGNYLGQSYLGAGYGVQGPGDVSIDATAWPEFALVAIEVNLEGGSTTSVDVYRVSPSGALSYVRGVVDLNTDGLAQLIVSDYEAPFGVPVTYTAVSRFGLTTTLSNEDTVTLEVDEDYLNDLDDVRNTGPILVESFRELKYDAPQGIHQVQGRRTPVVTSDIRKTPTGQLVLVTSTAEESRRIRDAVGSSSPILFRTPPEHGVGNMFLLPTNVVERRVSRLATEPSRRWIIDVVQIDRPDPTLFVPVAVTWQDILDTFDTWQELLDARADWGQVLYSFDGITTPPGFSTEPDWPASDA